MLLTPITATVFAAEASKPVRVEFVLGPDGRPTTLVVTGETWSRDEIPRNR